MFKMMKTVKERISKAVKDIDGKNLLRCPVCGRPVKESTLAFLVIYECSKCDWGKVVDLSDIKVNDV